MIDFTNYFEDLFFYEPTHKYFVNEEEYPSVSGLIKNFCNPFDKNLHIKIARGDKKKANELKKQWDAIRDLAANEGTQVHSLLENVANIYKENPDSTVLSKTIGGINFFQHLKTEYKVAATELKMYSKKHRYCGTADLVLYNTLTDKYIICDYKTNGFEKMFKVHNDQHMLSPFESLKDNAFNHYQLQLSYYQIMIEEITGIKIEERWLIWLNENHEFNYKVYKLEDYTYELTKILEND